MQGIVALGVLVAALVLGVFLRFFSRRRSCLQWPDGSWSCTRWDNQFSGVVGYRVEVDGLGCRHAVQVGPEGEGSSARLSGCVRLGNYLL